MKKKFLRHPITLILTLLALALLPALLTACDNGECKHTRTKDTTHEPDCSHQGYVLHECRDCGYTSSTPLENIFHIAGGATYHYDSTSHWYSCSACARRSSVVDRMETASRPAFVAPELPRAKIASRLLWSCVLMIAP